MSRSAPSASLLVGLVGFTLAGLVSLSLASFQPSHSDLPAYEHLGMNFQLESTDDTYDSLSSAQGKAVLLSFGFTSCHDICPMMLDKFRKMYKKLDEQQLSSSVVMYFVTLDPERDTLDGMKAHFEGFDKRIIGLTGTQLQIDTLQQSLAVSSQALEGSDQISHSDRIFLFDTKGQLRAMPPLTDSVSHLFDMVEGLL